jgi:hypothetical protein
MAVDTLLASCKYRGTVTFKNVHILINADIKQCNIFLVLLTKSKLQQKKNLILEKDDVKITVF